ncbi:MAG TPA: acyl-CoA dehydrogenase family protein [Candidatus Binatia bacterium]|jgi:alkylation response protein AidB-like acyl-CoA dehydrogenase|nr:acyl-CoA dehydrogenase family protein [Candidatus Binatia bacterium]
MDLTYSPEERAFQREVRAWLKANVPKKDKADNPLESADKARIARAKVWQRKLFDAGYVAMRWPKEYGGQGADVMRQTIVNEEMVRARAPQLLGGMGIQMVGPTLIGHGTEDQRRRFLPKILTADEIWCQGYSEPGSGSDLASLRTRAEIVGDEFLINGQKIWTSNAQNADWMFCLVRTDPDAPKHRGISYVLIDMRSPGVTVRPLVQMTGDPGFNEVFFEDVRVPRGNLVGQLHDGWTVANSTLLHERNMLASTTRTQQILDNLLRLARTQQRNGKPASKDPIIRQRLADLAIKVETMKLESYRQLTDALRKRPPGINASVNKLVTCEINHQLARAAIELMGDYGWLGKKDARVRDAGVWPNDYMFALGLIIGGGTAQVQKNIIAERGLGLPREPRPS